jgi:hypothetical protein
MNWNIVYVVLFNLHKIYQYKCNYLLWVAFTYARPAIHRLSKQLANLYENIYTYLTGRLDFFTAAIATGQVESAERMD